MGSYKTGIKVLSNTPIFDGDRFLGLLEVDTEDLVDGKFEPATEGDIYNYLPAYQHLANSKRQAEEAERE